MITDVLVRQIGYTILVCLVGYLVHREIEPRFERLVSRVVDEKIAPIAENVFDVCIVLVASVSLVKIWKVDVTSLLAYAGVLSVIIGITARSTISNFFASLALYSDDVYQKGDFVSVEDGVSGVVRDISVRSTEIQTRDGNTVSVPNSELNTSQITNHSDPTEIRRMSTQVSVD